jgi:hypothetical protein
MEIQNNTMNSATAGQLYCDISNGRASFLQISSSFFCEISALGETKTDSGCVYRCDKIQDGQLSEKWKH